MNCINPGWVRTPLVEKQIEAKAKQMNIPIDQVEIYPPLFLVLLFLSFSPPSPFLLCFFLTHFLSCISCIDTPFLSPLAGPLINSFSFFSFCHTTQAAKALLAEKQPSGQFVTLEQLAETAVFLSSDSAAQITGQSLAVDGGWTAQ